MADLLTWFGIKCSSWVAVNVGTSWRSACASTGDVLKTSVRESNCMLERTRFSKCRLKDTYFQTCCL